MKNSFKVIYIDYNFIDKRYPNAPEDGDAFFTYGFGSIYARKFKKYNPEIKVQCWKADSRVRKIHEKSIEGVHFKVFPSIRFGKLGHYSRSLIKQLKKEIKSHEKIIFNISSIRHLLFYSVAMKLKNRPLVVQHHGEASAIYKTKVNKGFKKIFYFFQKPIEKKAFKNIDLFYVLDKRIKEYLPLKNTDVKIKLQTTGVDETIFYPINKKEARLALSLDEDKKYLLYVGRLNYTKRPDILIDIYKELKKERQDIELIIAGTEKDDPLYNYAKESGAKIYGDILQTELYKFLSAADVYILPKLFKQIPFGGIGMLSVQALLCETPIVGSTVARFPEKDRDHVGFAVSEFGDIKVAILKILDGKVNFSNLREIAMKYYSWERISNNTNEDYKELMSD